MNDRRSIVVTLAITAIFGAVAMLYSLVWWHFQMRWQHGIRQDFWYQPGDVWNMIDGGRFVAHGALGYVYMGVGDSYALPLSYILSAPISAVIDHFQLIEGIGNVPQPSAWLVVAPFTLLMNAFVLDAARRTAWDLGMRQKLWQIQAATVLVVCVPAFQFGHFEDVLALTFVLHAVRYVFARRPLVACLLLSLAISFKQWAILAVPLLIVASPRGRRLAGVVAAGALPVLFTGMVLATDARDGAPALFSPVNPLRADAGHLSFFFTWFGSKTPKVTRMVSAALATPLALLFRRTKSRALFLAALSVVLLTRPLAEPKLYAYYLMPSLVTAGLVGIDTHQRFRVRDWIWQVLAIIWTLPYGGAYSHATWWLIELLLLALTWTQVAVNCRNGTRTISLPALAAATTIPEHV